MTSAIDDLPVYQHPQSHGRAWATCLSYLERECNPHFPDAYPLSTLTYAQVLWMLAECLKVQTVLEIGIGPQAVSGMIFAHSMGTRGGGVLYSIDVDESRPDPKYRRIADDQNVAWHVSYGDSLALIDSLPPTLQVDLLYVDGDHDYAHAYGDTVGYEKYLKPGGYLVIDDFPGCDGVVDADRALTRQGWQFIHLSHHPPHGNGRLVMQKDGRTWPLMR